MSLDTFWRLVANGVQEHGWREGQSAFNTLYMVNPALANSIRGSVGTDPFHIDEWLPTFRVWLEESWPS